VQLFDLLRTRGTSTMGAGVAVADIYSLLHLQPVGLRACDSGVDPSSCAFAMEGRPSSKCLPSTGPRRTRPAESEPTTGLLPALPRRRTPATSALRGWKAPLWCAR